jgi:hypothetical protein
VTTPQSVSGELPIAGGILRATIVPGEGRNQIKTVQFAGALQASSPDALRKLQDSLQGRTIDEAPGLIEDFFRDNPGAVTGVQPGELLTVLTLAFMKVRIATSTAPDPNEWKKELK